MKKLFGALLLFAATTTAHAALFINNNTDFDMSLQLTAHDAVLTPTCSYYAWIEVASHTARAYNNVTDLNPHWTSNATGFPNYVTISGSGIWDATGVAGASQTIGDAGTCATATSVTFSGMGATFKATWTNLGGGNILVDIVQN